MRAAAAPTFSGVLPGGNPICQLLQPGAHAVHGPDALAALKRLAFLGMHHEHPYAVLFGGDLLNQGPGWPRLLAGGDADRAFDPRPRRARDVVEHLAAAAAVATDNVAMPVRTQQIEVLAGHHAAVADEHDALEPEALLDVAQDLGDGGGVAPIAGKHVMRNRPAVDQDQPDQHLRVARLAVAAVTIGADPGRSCALEIGRGQIVEHHIDLEREQIAQAEKQRVLDLRLALEQLIEGPVPTFELAHLHAYPWDVAGVALGILAPCRNPAPAVRSHTKSVSSQRANPCSLPGAMSR